MKYNSAEALRMALEYRLRDQSGRSGVTLDRLRRRVMFERVVARLELASPGAWVLKGGMALEVRLGDRARLTKDIDLGLREADVERAGLRGHLVAALSRDPFDDRFVFAVGPLHELMSDGSGSATLRSSLSADLAGRPFGRMHVDVSPRVHELMSTDSMPLPNSLAFAGIGSVTIEVVDINRHAAEKLHALARQFDDRENTRVRDLLDIVLLLENEALDPLELRRAVWDVWQERSLAPPPRRLPVLPGSWQPRYERLAADTEVATRSFCVAVEHVAALWSNIAE